MKTFKQYLGENTKEHHAEMAKHHAELAKKYEGGDDEKEQASHRYHRDRANYHSAKARGDTIEPKTSGMKYHSRAARSVAH